MGAAARAVQVGVDSVNLLQTFAKSLDIKVYQELTEARVKDMIELALQLSIEPFRGISEKGLDAIKAMKDSQDILSKETKIIFGVFVGIAALALSVSRYIKNKPA